MLVPEQRGIIGGRRDKTDDLRKKLLAREARRCQLGPKKRGALFVRDPLRRSLRLLEEQIGGRDVSEHLQEGRGADCAVDRVHRVDGFRRLKQSGQGVKKRLCRRIQHTVGWPRACDSVQQRKPVASIVDAQLASDKVKRLDEHLPHAVSFAPAWRWSASHDAPEEGIHGIRPTGMSKARVKSVGAGDPIMLRSQHY